MTEGLQDMQPIEITRDMFSADRARWLDHPLFMRFSARSGVDTRQDGSRMPSPCGKPAGLEDLLNKGVHGGPPSYPQTDVCTQEF